MLNPDFSDRMYTAEVIRVRTKSEDAMSALVKLTHEPRRRLEIVENVDSPVRIVHAYFPSRRQFHRSERQIIAETGERLEIPRRIQRRGSENFLYDVLIAQSAEHIVVAVPFHDLAEEFFVRSDSALAGTGALYEKLDITGLVIRLGSGGVLDLQGGDGAKTSISVTRCHLAYTDLEGRSRNLQQIQITGANLGATKQYQHLIAPVIESKTKTKKKTNKPAATTKAIENLWATPVILGFVLSSGGVRKSSATTDRHGNFKVWVSPGLRRLIRLFSLLETINSIEDIASTTANVPILQSGAIRGAENQQ
jgi:hypothetical protein